MKWVTIGLAAFSAAPFGTTAQAQDEHAKMFAALPAPAVGPEIDPDKRYRVKELGRGLYLLNDGVCQHAWSRGPSVVLLASVQLIDEIHS